MAQNIICFLLVFLVAKAHCNTPDQGLLARLLSSTEHQSWESVDKSGLDEQEKLNRVRRLGNLDNKQYFKNDYGYTNSSNNFYHVDINRDGNLDIVYYGYLNGEMLTSIFFIQSGRDFRYAGSIMGEVYSITTQNDIMSIMLKVEDHSGNFTIYLEEYTFSKEATSWTPERALSFISLTDIPPLDSSYSEPKTFELHSVTRYNMRLSPSINSDSVYNYPTEPVKGNIAAVLYGTANGKVLTEVYEQKSGKTWCLVVLDKKFMVDGKHRFNPPINNIEKYQVIGWISDRYVTYK